MPRRTCQGQTTNGHACQSWTLRDSDFCLAHDNRLEVVELRKKAAELAGQSQKLNLPATVEARVPELILPSRPLRLTKVRDIKRGIAKIIQAVQLGQLDLDQARTLLYGFDKMIQAVRDLEAPERLEKLEQIVRERGLFQD